MGKNFYISDLHMGHGNVIKFDNRPFCTVAEMDQALIDNWNSVVTNVDTVYILGDFCWDKEDRWIEILKQLRGNKQLIKGNHDLKNPSAQLKCMFQDIKDYKEITDNGKHVIMSHYPIPFYKADYNPKTYMLYGHVHTTIENDFMEHLKKYIYINDQRGNSAHQCQMYNVGCMMPWMDYTPRTLDEIIAAQEDI